MKFIISLILKNTLKIYLKFKKKIINLAPLLILIIEYNIRFKILL